MSIMLHASHRFTAAADAVFALGIDAERFPQTFPGYGLIPAIRRIELHDAPGLGARRTIHNSDGTALVEQVTHWEPPLRHGYELSGFRAPFAWLVRRGTADWQLQADADGCRVDWYYRFEAASALARPLAWLLLRGLMQPAMQRCLRQMDALLQRGG